MLAAFRSFRVLTRLHASARAIANRAQGRGGSVHGRSIVVRHSLRDVGNRRSNLLIGQRGGGTPASSTATKLGGQEWTAAARHQPFRHHGSARQICSGTHRASQVDQPQMEVRIGQCPWCHIACHDGELVMSFQHPHHRPSSYRNQEHMGYHEPP